MIFLTFLRVTEMCSFRLVLERKTGKDILESSRLEFLEKFLANNFAWSDAEDNTSRLLNRGGIADLPLLRTLLAICQKLWEPGFWEVMDSFFISKCKIGTIKKPLAMITSQNFTLDSEDLLFWYKGKNWLLWTMAAAQAAENHGNEWGLTWYLQWEIYRSIPTWTHSQNSLAAAEARSLNIFFELWIWWKVSGN